MPLVRYFVFVGLALIGLLLGADYLASKSGPATVDIVRADHPPLQNSAPKSSIDYWRAAQQRHDRPQDNAAIDLNTIATLAPTTERLQWEKMLRYVPEGGLMDARAEAPRKALEKELADNEHAKPVSIDKPAIDRPAAETPAPARKRAVAKLPSNPRMAADPRDYWGRPYYRDDYRYGTREPYRSPYGQSWAGRFSFFN